MIDLEIHDLTYNLKTLSLFFLHEAHYQDKCLFIPVLLETSTTITTTTYHYHVQSISAPMTQHLDWERGGGARDPFWIQKHEGHSLDPHVSGFKMALARLDSTP